ncbi:MAG: glycoside hydrolase family 97 catalytic domain-containing protein [Acidobacteriia bacterium]|nr:glycoside hydrolase family 97 catalytic domain-containing protein [Terriglobia bacterium]
MVNFYERCVRKTSERHLTMDLRGAYKPPGLRRTYPNLLTREGVIGMEYCKWSDRVTPQRDVPLPFTRMLAGPMVRTNASAVTGPTANCLIKRTASARLSASFPPAWSNSGIEALSRPSISIGSCLRRLAHFLGRAFFVPNPPTDLVMLM